MLSRRLLRLKVVKALYAYVQSHDDNINAAKKNLALAIDKTYELTYYLPALLVAVARYAEERQEIARNKKLPTREDLNPNRKFVENEVVRRIADDEGINDFLALRKLDWVRYPEAVKNVYTHLLDADFYKEYMANPERSFKEDLQFVADFFAFVSEDEDVLETTIEEQSIYWADDLGYAAMSIVKTLSALRPSHLAVKMPPKVKSEDDLEFARELFEKSVMQFERNRLLVDRFSGNWDVERIAFMDIVIMAVALTELKDFPTIPVKVTLDEYIEISKFYSTPNSSVFINGILDKAVETLTAEGEIDKTGRGLI